MKIKKHGDKIEKKSKPVSFKCDNCGCEFSAKEDEYYRDFGGAEKSGSIWSGSISVSYTIKDYLVCSCPECYKIVKVEDERENTSFQSITVSGSSLSCNDPANITTKTNVPYTLSADEVNLVKEND